MEFDFKKIEKKWQANWVKNNTYKVTEDPSKPKYYVLDMFPYPSGAGLHVGHPLGYVASDIFARYKRLKGYNVLHPMGFDAFGLPAEQYAIETGTHPAITTENAIARYREQLDKIGFSFDWSRQVKTCDPQYYKWTQWLFLQLFESWYNPATNRAEPIATLVEQFKVQGLKFKTDESDREKLWSELTFYERETILQNYRLAYRSFTEVNWCEALGCVLANDEVKDGKSERGGYPITRKKMRQWSLRITPYADRLLEGLARIDWSESIKEQQRNWIGKSEGVLLKFLLSQPFPKVELEVFTTRIDTLFGATFLVIAPEHELLQLIVTDAQRTAVDAYLAYVKSRSDIERQQEKKVTGCFTGAYAVHPFTGAPLPIWTAEYVLAGYGTGAIMAVPADDERDRKFAETFGLPILNIIDKSMYPGASIEDKKGKLIHSDFLDGMEVPEAIEAMTKRIEEMGIGKRQINYKMRDASYSRQRYWGEPFPIKYIIQDKPDSPFVGTNNEDAADIPVAITENELPLVLPEVHSFKPTGDGRSPLANNKEWVANNYETDTMPGYAGSSWYFLRYMDPHNQSAFAAKEKLDYWQQVDLYVGGSEHAVGHLLYARFFTKVLYDLGYLNFDEPFKKLVNQGMIQGKSSKVYRVKESNTFVSKNLKDGYETSELNADISLVENDILDIARFKSWREDFAHAEFILENGQYVCGSEVEKMSKSKYNVVNPDDVIEKYGADCFRLFEMFLGPLEQSKPWDDKGISGVANFLRKFWRLFYDEKGQWRITDATAPVVAHKVLHKLLKKIESDIERLSFNTCVSAFMIAVNELTALGCHEREVLQPLLIALAPFAPYMTEELWEKLGHAGSIHHTNFPVVDEAYLIESTHQYGVSVNGKIRAEIELPIDISETDAKARVLALEKIRQYTNGQEPKKFILVRGRIINVVV